MYFNDTRASLVLLLGVFQYLLLGATATTYKVYASGGDLTLDEAMSLAGAGDTVSLADGTYDEAIVSKRDGEEGSPITVKGGRGAIINGDYSSKNVRITHSYVTLEVGGDMQSIWNIILFAIRQLQMSTNTLLNFTMLMILIHTYTPCVEYSPCQANVPSNVVMCLTTSCVSDATLYDMLIVCAKFTVG